MSLLITEFSYSSFSKEQCEIFEKIFFSVMLRFNNKCSAAHHCSTEDWKQVLIEMYTIKYCNYPQLQQSSDSSLSNGIKQELLSSYYNILTLYLGFSVGDVAFPSVND